mgnify:CR=1 FL=1
MQDLCKSLAATCGLILLAAAWASAADRTVRTSAHWEREASQWAVSAYQDALEKNPDELARANESLAPQQITPLPETTVKANQDRGFVIFSRPYHQRIDKRLPPSAAEVLEAKFEIAAARNEWEPLQIGVYALRTLRGFAFTVSDLVHSSGKDRIHAGPNTRKLYGMNLLMRVGRQPEHPDGDIGYEREGKTAWKYEEPPAVLVDLPYIEIPRGEARSLWLDIHVPQSAAPGVYHGQIQFWLARKQAAEVPLTVTVYPFVLDEAAEWSRGPFTSGFLERDQLIQLREHGINNMSWWTTGGSKIELVDGKIVADFSPYQRYLRLLDICGYVGPHVVFLGGSDPKIQNTISKMLGRDVILDARNKTAAEAFRKADLSEPFGKYLCQTLKQFHEQAKAVGHPDLLACLLDEPDHVPRPERRDWYNRMFKIVEEGAPEVPLYGTFYHEGDEDRLSHHHKVWCTNCPSPSKYNACRKAGQNLFTYHFDFRYCDGNERQRFRLGILPWVYGAKGTYFWAMYWHDGDPFDPFVEKKNYDTACIPTPHGPLATPVIKTVREGIDDRRYLATLEKLIDEAIESGSAGARAEAKADRLWLESFREPLFDKLEIRGGRPVDGKVPPVTIQRFDGGKITLGPDESTAFAFATAVRQDVARRIISLQAKLSPTTQPVP